MSGRLPDIVTLDTIKQLTKHMYHPQKIHLVVQVAIIPTFRYSAAMANWDSKEIDKHENLWMSVFKKAWKVSASLPDVTFWAGPEQGGLGTRKARAIITSETISLMNQCMCLDDDLRQVTIQDMSQAIAHLGCSTIAEAQVELQWSGKDWKQQPSLCHRFLACTSRGIQIEWTAIQQTTRGTPQGRGEGSSSRVTYTRA